MPLQQEYPQDIDTVINDWIDTHHQHILSIMYDNPDLGFYEACIACANSYPNTLPRSKNEAITELRRLQTEAKDRKLIATIGAES